MPASAWSRMWQWNIHAPGRSSKRTAIVSSDFVGTFTVSFHSGTRVVVLHLEEIAVQVERMREVRVVDDAPDLRVAERDLERLRFPVRARR